MSLDPEDWGAARAAAHRLLDACLDRMENAGERPWQPVDPEAKARLSPPLPQAPRSLDAICESLVHDVMPHATGNTHPRFFGWVHGTGLFSGFLAEMTAAAMNSNCGGRDHGGLYVERAVIDWCRQIFGFPEDAGGILTTGTSMAALLSLVAARRRIAAGAPGEALVGYGAEGCHSAHAKVFEIMGLPPGNLRRIPADARGAMSIEALRARLASDRAEGLVPFLVIGTAGSVGTGSFDPLDAIASLCAEQGLWFHVDGAFGAWVRLAGQPWSDLARGIERADSLAFDFHKWMYVQYDCGAVLVRDARSLLDVFSSRPSYLDAAEHGLAAGGAWACDFGLELSRGFRALKVWTALQAHGLDAFAAQIRENCEQAREMGALVERSAVLELAAPVQSNVVCFRPRDPAADVARIAARLQIAGEAVFSTVSVGTVQALRAAIVNHRTTRADIAASIAAVEAALCDGGSG